MASFQNSSDDANYLCKLSFFLKTKQATVDLVKTHIEESQTNPDNEDIYEDMLTASKDFITNFNNEDIYESMIKLNPEMGLYMAFSFKTLVYFFLHKTVVITE